MSHARLIDFHAVVHPFRIRQLLGHSSKCHKELGSENDRTRVVFRGDAGGILQTQQEGEVLSLTCLRFFASTQLVKGMIREIKPQVVMLELDAESIYLLPMGIANQVRHRRRPKPSGCV